MCFSEQLYALQHLYDDDDDDDEDDDDDDFKNFHYLSIRFALISIDLSLILYDSS